jgi:acyl carrier protein
MDERVRTFVATQTKWDRSSDELTADYPLIESGVLDSLGLFELVSYLEETCGVLIEDAEITPSNFASLRSISKLVESKATMDHTS